MTWNMSYLSDFKEFDGGYVTFGGGAKGGKIIGKGTLKSADKSQVLLKVPRKNNMYSVDIKNIVPKESLTCLVAKATLDESMLWHRRLGTNSNDFVDSLLFDSSSKNASNDEPQPSSDVGKKDDEGVSKESGIDDQERPENSTQDVNIDGPSINTASTNINTEVDISNISTTYLVPSTPNTRIHKDHSLDHVIGDVQSGEEPNKVIQALKDPSWIEAMQEELLQFKLQQVWTLVDLPYGKRAIGIKWIYRNKKDERGTVVRNKVRLVAQGYTQEEGIDYDEVFAPVARIESIRLFLAFASFKDFVVYQMNVKSAFMYGNIEEEVYVCQPLGFEDPEFPDRVYKVEKVLYGLHQAPRAWYETLFTYLLDNGFQRGQIDKTIFTKRVKGDMLLVQMSSMGELTFFLGLQVTQKDDGIFICQDKYVHEILKKFGFSTMKTASTPMETSKPLMKDENAEDVDVHLYRSMIGLLIIFRYLKCQPKLGLWYPKDSPFDLEAYTNNDYAGASLDRKSTTRGSQFLGSRLILRQCKKQTIVANSTTEAELMIRMGYKYFLDEIRVYTSILKVSAARLKDSGPELTGFSDVDYAGCKDTFKSTSVGTQFLGEKL
nr:hypothetical protein [Tanacetum cinerariifolium]